MLQEYDLPSLHTMLCYNSTYLTHNKNSTKKPIDYLKLRKTLNVRAMTNDPKIVI